MEHLDSYSAAYMPAWDQHATVQGVEHCDLTRHLPFAIRAEPTAQHFIGAAYLLSPTHLVGRHKAEFFGWRSL